MSEMNPLEGRSWERFPAERRAEITLILGRMAHRQLGKSRRVGEPDHECDDGEPDAGRRLVALAGCR